MPRRLCAKNDMSLTNKGKMVTDVSVRVCSGVFFRNIAFLVSDESEFHKVLFDTPYDILMNCAT